MLSSFDFAKSCTGSNLAGVHHTNCSKQPHKFEDGQKSGFLFWETWASGCEMPDASNVIFASPLVSHSLVAKSPLGV